MDHIEAVQLQAAEKYVLGELAPELREQFEEHYFDCAECAKDLKALATFVTASRMIFKETEFSAQAPSHEVPRERANWFRWFRPAISVPAIAILAAIISFQNAVTIPSARKHAATQTSAEVYESSYRLQGATRGGNITKVMIRPNESFALDFDFTPAQVFPRYKGSVVDSSGHAVRTFEITGEQTNKELHLVVPGGIVHRGNYELVVVGDTGSLKQGPQNSEVLRIPFVVESER